VITSQRFYKSTFQTLRFRLVVPMRAYPVPWTLRFGAFPVHTWYIISGICFRKLCTCHARELAVVAKRPLSLKAQGVDFCGTLYTMLRKRSTPSNGQALCALPCHARGFQCNRQLIHARCGVVDFRFQGISLERCQTWISRSLRRGCVSST
jgi:hypothetical protein